MLYNMIHHSIHHLNRLIKVLKPILVIYADYSFWLIPQIRNILNKTYDLFLFFELLVLRISKNKKWVKIMPFIFYGFNLIFVINFLKYQIREVSEVIKSLRS